MSRSTTATRHANRADPSPSPSSASPSPSSPSPSPFPRVGTSTSKTPSFPSRRLPLRVIRRNASITEQSFARRGDDEIPKRRGPPPRARHPPSTPIPSREPPRAPRRRRPIAARRARARGRANEPARRGRSPRRRQTRRPLVPRRRRRTLPRGGRVSIVNTLDAPRARPREEIHARRLFRGSAARAREGATSARRARFPTSLADGARDGKQVEGIVPARALPLRAPLSTPGACGIVRRRVGSDGGRIRTWV